MDACAADELQSGCAAQDGVVAPSRKAAAPKPREPAAPAAVEPHEEFLDMADSWPEGTEAWETEEVLQRQLLEPMGKGCGCAERANAQAQVEGAASLPGFALRQKA